MQLILNYQIRWRIRSIDPEEHTGLRFSNNLCKFVDSTDYKRRRILVYVVVNCPDRQWALVISERTCWVLAAYQHLGSGGIWPPLKMAATSRTRDQLLMRGVTVHRQRECFPKRVRSRSSTYPESDREWKRSKVWFYVPGQISPAPQMLTSKDQG